MADRMRVAYENGQVLGAEHLSADQAYFRAALERRSLARDMFGVAFGLELGVVRTEARGEIVRVEPGVAFGGDGRVIVVPAPADLSDLLRGRSARDASYAVHLAYAERKDEALGGVLHDLPSERWIVEGHRFELEAEPRPPEPAGRREGPRLAPQAPLGAQRGSGQGRVRLGYVDFDGEGRASVRAAARPPHRAAPAAEPGARVEPGAPAAEPGARVEPEPAAGVQHAGLVGAALAHPRAWGAARGGELAVAIELDPVRGVHVHHEAVHHAQAFFTSAIFAGAIVAQEGLACELQAEGDPASLPRRAVTWGDTGVRPASRNEQARVLGVVASAEGTRARVVVSGATRARVTGKVRPGDWLSVGEEEGALSRTEEPRAGTLVAKALEAVEGGGEIRVLVCLG
ncbi:hypothetical protein [Sorangium sp. So ce1024]|uniref:hypothetical protein n=1 Tax=Sorangium sp. So ce1024 TaxID=3133327 RepID=UPI003F0889C3